MNINKHWHLSRKMPKNPSMEERIRWHLAHSKNCKCRLIPEILQKDIFTKLLQKEKA